MLPLVVALWHVVAPPPAHNPPQHCRSLSFLSVRYRVEKKKNDTLYPKQKAPPQWRSFVVNAEVIAAILPASEKKSVALDVASDVPPVKAEENVEDGWEGSPSRTTIRRGRLRRLPGVRRRAIDLIIYEGSLLSRRKVGTLILGGASRLDAFSASPVWT